MIAGSCGQGLNYFGGIQTDTATSCLAPGHLPESRYSMSQADLPIPLPMIGRIDIRLPHNGNSRLPAITPRGKAPTDGRPRRWMGSLQLIALQGLPSNGNVPTRP